jgi:serine phosphatase RsbU (regulator of sigma subunit)
MYIFNLHRKAIINQPLFRTLGFLKKVIAICCFAALLLSTSSLSYFYKLQEKLHEQERFASIDAGEILEKENDDHGNNHKSDQITITVKDKSILPQDYQWEEKGREFSYKGMFYDIISIEQTKEGWVIKAASDEEEAAIVANQHKLNHLDKEAQSKSRSSKIKLSLSLAVYECPSFSTQSLINYTLLKKKYPSITTPILSSYSGAITHPPETV